MSSRKLDRRDLTNVIAAIALCNTFASANAQTIQPVTVKVEFHVNETPLTMTIPSGFTVVADSATLETIPYPENQNLYFILKPTMGDENRHVAVGSRPELNKTDISRQAFAAMAKSFTKDSARQELRQSVARFESLVNQWRAKKGQPGFQSAKMIDATATDDAIVITAVVSNKDGSEVVNSVRMQHAKNRIVVLAVSSPLKSRGDITWVVSTMNRLKDCLR